MPTTVYLATLLILARTRLRNARPETAGDRVSEGPCARAGDFGVEIVQPSLEGFPAPEEPETHVLRVFSEAFRC
jgi:hypothetical protein